MGLLIQSLCWLVSQLRITMRKEGMKGKKKQNTKLFLNLEGYVSLQNGMFNRRKQLERRHRCPQETWWPRGFVIPSPPHSPLWARVSSSSRLYDHTQTHHTRYDSSGRVISPTQRSLPDNTQHSQETGIHVPAGFEPAILASEWPQTHAYYAIGLRK